MEFRCAIKGRTVRPLVLFARQRILEASPRGVEHGVTCPIQSARVNLPVRRKETEEADLETSEAFELRAQGLEDTRPKRRSLREVTGIRSTQSIHSHLAPSRSPNTCNVVREFGVRSESTNLAIAAR
jgi:hypothetical protein